MDNNNQQYQQQPYQQQYQQQYQQPYQQYYQPPKPKRTPVIGIIALILALFSVFTLISPYLATFIGMFPLAFGLLGLITCPESKGISIAAIVISSVVVLIGAFFWALVLF